MPVLTFSSAPRPDRSFAIGLATVAVFGLAQIVGVGVHYIGRMRPAPEAPKPPSVAVTQPAAPAATAPAATAPAKGVPAAPSTTQPAPTTLSLAERLLAEATALRERGDTTNALARLQDASQRDPTNANVLAEMAMIYESIQLFDRSNESWRKIQQIGASAGALYELADMKLKIGVPSTATTTTGGPGLAGVSPLGAGASRADPEGIPDGSTFGITEVAPTENPDPDAETNLTLKIGVKKRADSIIDHTKVKIQVFFYDMMDNNQVALTDADVSYEWLTPNHDWKASNPEVLSVTYLRTKNKDLSSDAALSEAAAAVTVPMPGRKAKPAKRPDGAAGGARSEGDRKYYGYIVRVYYNDQLQAVRADPTKLLNMYPPPFTAPSQ